MSPILVVPFLGLLLTPAAWRLAVLVTESAVGRRARRSAAWRLELAEIDAWLDAIKAAR
jgi:hypothetical protein